MLPKDPSSTEFQDESRTLLAVALSRVNPPTEPSSINLAEQIRDT
jgi:hypothetical protein